ncbi:LysR substrate-binding domain-containing protein [Candidatus Burkholderia verschuerenii]|uniref:LysR substrate-binding domain-containing protein n=1 Tax=Candidatus Burkholderia verschuerenii TaxID=242163 RepID=UPI0009F99144
MGYLFLSAAIGGYVRDYSDWARRAPHCAINGGNARRTALASGERPCVAPRAKIQRCGAAARQWCNAASNYATISAVRLRSLPCQASCSLSLEETLRLQLLAERQIVMSSAGSASGLNVQVQRLFERHGLALQVGPSAPQLASMMALVSAGLGVALLPASAATPLRAGVRDMSVSKSEAHIDTLVICRQERLPWSIKIIPWRNLRCSRTTQASGSQIRQP